jgi:hypothetical protein
MAGTLLLSHKDMNMRWCLLALGASLLLPNLRADDPPKSAESLWQKLFRQQAADYHFTLADEEQKVVVSKEPILFWSQPVRGGDDGGVFLWTSAGRPVAIGTFFIWPPAEGGQAVSHELHSLSSQPFTAAWKSRRWKSPKDGIRYETINDVDPPADSAEKRLLQLKQIARKFTASSHGRDDRDWELRTLPRPLYRNELPKDNKSEVIDGALFGLVQGTDLEIVLLLEAVQEGKAKSWRWAAARMSDLPLSLKLSGKEVWHVDKANFDNAEAAYFCSTVERYDGPPKE